MRYAPKWNSAIATGDVQELASQFSAGRPQARDRQNKGLWDGHHTERGDQQQQQELGEELPVQHGEGEGGREGGEDAAQRPRVVNIYGAMKSKWSGVHLAKRKMSGGRGGRGVGCLRECGRFCYGLGQ